MFEPAGQSPADTNHTDAARQNGSHGDGGQIGAARRYTAEDFRALISRVSKGGAKPKSRFAALPIVLPDFPAWPRPSAPQPEAEDEAEVALAAQDAGDQEQEFGTDLDEAHAFPAEADDSPLAEPPALDDPPVAAGDATSGAEPGDVAAPGQVMAYDTAEPEPAPAGVVEAAASQPAFEPEREPGPESQSEPVADASDVVVDPELQSAETARTLLDIMAMPSGVQPQERALAGDTLLRLVSRMPVASLIGLCDRLCIMEAPPPLLIRRLIHHHNMEVAGPLLERCPGISDQDLMSIVTLGKVNTLRLIARRRHLSPALTDALIRHGDGAVTIAVVRNPGASLSHEAFSLLAESAKSRTALQAPLATRADTPAPIAFELFWTLPPQLRRYVLSRFLTESANLDRILKIAQTLDESVDGSGSPRIADKAECDALVSLIAEGKTTEAAHKLAGLAGISEVNAERIITDSEGEPLTVAMKAIGMSRTQSAAAAATLRDAPAAPLRSNRRIAELQNLFDSLSFTKARVLLTYWDWAIEQSGPYSGDAA